MIRNSAGTAKMQVQDNGNVGISTTVPAALFDVSNALEVFSDGNVGIGTAFIDPYIFNVYRTYGGRNYPWVIFNLSADARWPTLQFGLLSSVITYYYQTNPECMQINAREYNTGNGHQFQVNAVEKIRINKEGNVGIGTIAPASMLAVVGGMAVGAVYASGTTAPASGMIVQGNVGVGTYTPTLSLDVNSLRIRTSAPPATSATACHKGDLAWENAYIYVCDSDNHWMRAALSP